MAARTRSYDKLHEETGTYQYWTGWTWQTKSLTKLIGTNGTCHDNDAGRGQDNLFDVTHYYRVYPSFEGDYYQGEVCTKKFRMYPLQVQTAPYNPEAPFPLPTTGQWQGIAQSAAAATNPSVPHVSLPTFLGELKDLPGMLQSIPEALRTRGKSLIDWARRVASDPMHYPRELGNLKLAYSFGWRPLVRDLMSMLGFMDAINKRIRTLQKLRSGRSIKRRQLLPSQSSLTTVVPLYSHTSGITTKHRKEIWYRAESWVSVRWTLDANAVLPQTDEDMYRRARDLAAGLTSYEAFATAWELLPWSWAVDWMWNFGAWFKGNNNSLPIHVESVCWMRTCTAKCLFFLTEGPSLPGVNLVGDFRTTSVCKRRVPVNPLLVTLPPLLPSVPVLSNAQWSILGAILSQRVG